jgi:hypothetical protein
MWIGSTAAVPRVTGGHLGSYSFYSPYLGTGIAFQTGDGRPDVGEVVVSIPTPVVVPEGRTKLHRVFFLYDTDTALGGKIEWLTIYDGTTVLQRIEDLARGNFAIGLGAENSFEFAHPPTLAGPISLLFTIHGECNFAGFGADLTA